MRIKQCRVCHGGRLRLFLDLGMTGLANSYLAPERLGEQEPAYPLRVVFCEDCKLVQIDEEVPAEDLFRHYLYVSGTSDLIHRHARFLADHFVTEGNLQAGDLVLEAASNDGTVLRAFQRHGVRTVGIEPATNIAEHAQSAGVETVNSFFNAETASQVRERYGPARLILARHVLAHVSDLHGFVRGLHDVLADDGLAAVEVPHLLPFHDRVEFDTVYHEHLCYFSLHVLETLFRRFELELVDVREAAIHGGSIIVSAQRRGGPQPRRQAIDQLLARETSAGLDRPEQWDAFARRVRACRAGLGAEIDQIIGSGRTLAGYGAPAKGMTLLSYCGLGPKQVRYLVDKSPLKQGLLTPCHHIPIYGPEQLLKDQPDTVLLLAWNFAPEILQQQAEYLRRGGRFLLPLPHPHYCCRAEDARHLTPGRLAA